jgi:hypothetical protein
LVFEVKLIDLKHCIRYVRAIFNKEPIFNEVGAWSCNENICRVIGVDRYGPIRLINSIGLMERYIAIRRMRQMAANLFLRVRKALYLRKDLRSLGGQELLLARPLLEDLQDRQAPEDQLLR